MLVPMFRGTCRTCGCAGPGRVPWAWRDSTATAAPCKPSSLQSSVRQPSKAGPSVIPAGAWGGREPHQPHAELSPLQPLEHRYMCRTVLKDEMERVCATRDNHMKTKYIAELKDLIFTQPLSLCNNSFKEDPGIIFLCKLCYKHISLC